MTLDLKETIFLVTEKNQLLKKVFLRHVKKMMIALLGKLKQEKLVTIKKKRLSTIKMLGLKYTINQ